jgi:O-antigen ligase
MGILLTGSRAAFGIMFFYIFVWNVYLYFRPIVPGRRASWYFINVAIMVIAVGYAYSQGIFERAMIHGETIYDIGEFGRSRRWDIAYGGIELFLSYPIFGIGPVDPGFHNTYIDMMACYGIVGTTPMCVLILVLFVLHGKRAFGRATKDDIQDVLVSFSVILSVIMWLMMGATIGAYRLLTIWVVCGIGLAVGRHRYSRNMVVVNGVNVK